MAIGYKYKFPNVTPLSLHTDLNALKMFLKDLPTQNTMHFIRIPLLLS